jgi:uncharacterized protein (TIGR02145 family)
MIKASLILVLFLGYSFITFVQTVTIGNQVWMTKNLNVDKFRNGDPIPHARTDEEWKKAGENEEPAWCYYESDTRNGEKFGKLYNWYAVNDKRGLAPSGYHVPTDIEWTTLTNYLGEDNGIKLKSTKGWNNNGNGTNICGFLGLPNGIRLDEGDIYFFGIGELGYWWSSTIGLTDYDSYGRHLDSDSNLLFRGCGSDYYNGNGFSVRCLRD